MTADELRWHKWLIANRRISNAVESIEYNDRANVEANLLRLSSSKGILYSLEWATTDGEWQGAITFVDSEDSPEWIKYTATTFDLTGAPPVIQNATDMKIMGLVSPSRTEPETTK